MRMLTKDPAARITLSEIMTHAWVTDEGVSPMDHGIFDRLELYETEVTRMEDEIGSDSPALPDHISTPTPSFRRRALNAGTAELLCVCVSCCRCDVPAHVASLPPLLSLPGVRISSLDVEEVGNNAALTPDLDDNDDDDDDDFEASTSKSQLSLKSGIAFGSTGDLNASKDMTGRRRSSLCSADLAQCRRDKPRTVNSLRHSTGPCHSPALIRGVRPPAMPTFHSPMGFTRTVCV